jgi:hypothetical protein
MATTDIDNEGRVKDWLDDKLQTLADLESLDKLLLNVRQSHSLFLRQLDDAKNDLDQAQQASIQHQKQLKDAKAAFEKGQRAIDNRMVHVTQSKTSDEAVQKFEITMNKLHQLDVASAYIDTLQQVETRREVCLKNLTSSTKTSLDAYTYIQSLLLRLEPLQIAADGAAPHLLDHIKAIVLDLRQKIEESLTVKLNAVLKKMQWPKIDQDRIPQDLQPEFAEIVASLLKLQKPDLEAQDKLHDESDPLVLLPLKILVEPLELGFRYHFDRENVMNRLDKPEFYLAHITERLLSKYADFMDANLQPILIQEFRASDLGLNYAYVDATSAFITALLPMVRTKSFAVLKQVATKPALLSHFIHELMKFDTELREEWQYDGGVRSETWPGVTGEILADDGTFSAWLKAEKEYTLSRYHTYVDSDDGFELDFDSLGEGKTKPSKVAIRVNNLLEGVTDNYKELVSFPYKLRFLLEVQVAIFDLFYRRLEDAYIAYYNRTSAITRISKEDQASLQGVEGLKKLCRIFGSADYIERAMQDWNDDVFFLELWSELQHRASAKSSQAIVTGSLTLAEVASQTSKSLETGDDGQDIFEGGALFDETALSYKRIRSKTEKTMSDLLANNVRNALYAYTRINPWSSLAPATESLVSTTAELDSLLQVLTSLISYLKRAVGTSPLRHIVKEMLHRIDETFYEKVIKEHMFSTAGALQFSADLTAIASLVAKITEDRSIVESGLARIKQANMLLNLPLREKNNSQEDDEASDTEDVGLIEAHERLVSGSGEAGKELLEELGIDRLGVFEAGRVLVRRIELGS